MASDCATLWVRVHLLLGFRAYAYKTSIYSSFLSINKNPYQGPYPKLLKRELDDGVICV